MKVRCNGNNQIGLNTEETIRDFRRKITNDLLPGMKFDIKFQGKILTDEN